MTDHLRLEQGLLAVRSPHSIVEEARSFIRDHVPERLTLQRVAKALLIRPIDLQACFRLASETSFDAELKAIRIAALYELIRAKPNEAMEDLIVQVGLESGSALGRAFEEAFWISLHDYHQHCRQCGPQPPS